GFNLGLDGEQRVEHEVSHLVDAVTDALEGQALHSGRGRTEEVARDMVGQDPVYLFRDVVVRTDAGLDVGNGQVELGGGEGAGKGRVGVAKNDYAVESLGEEYL